jgi:hypothetical protein
MKEQMKATLVFLIMSILTLFAGAYIDSLTYITNNVRDLSIRPFATATYVSSGFLFLLTIVTGIANGEDGE